MLSALQVRDIVLIDALELKAAPGLSVLTGETGAGKSIILDALGLALGDKADRSMVRAGAAQGSVTAVFDPPDEHAVFGAARAHGLVLEAPILLRRVLGEDGRSRAFVNDQPVTLALLRTLGGLLVEIHGQHDDRGLLDPASHRALLDEFADLGRERAGVAACFEAWRGAEGAETAHREAMQKAKSDADYLAHVVAELDALDAKEGEEAALAAERALLSHAEKIAEAFHESLSLIEDDGGVANRLNQALRRLERVSEKAQGRLDPALQALDRAAAELAEARAVLADLQRTLAFDPGRLDAIEARLFALHAACRKHDVTADALPALRLEFGERLAAIASAEDRAAELAAATSAARSVYADAATALSVERHAAAKKLDRAIARELKPLKLDKARFITAIETLDLARAGAAGLDRVSFVVATNPGTPPGPLARIASGGELARFILALKVVLAKGSDAATLIFDEVDQGVGGAVAAAVGARLALLAEAGQVLVVTHSPQVAARADHHWRIVKTGGGNGAARVTRIEVLDADARREEIARMLAGATVTDEARAAAEKLLADPLSVRASA